MIMPVVFLSHSSKDNARAMALHQALVAGGRVATTFDVRDLRHGEEWGPQLHRWMARCQGGVLLITQQVMERPDWVLREAAYLRSRSLLEGESFKLFLIVDTAVLGRADWQQRFGPLDLGALQHFKLADPGDPIAPAVAKIEAAMQPVADFGSDHRGRLAEAIFDALDPFLAETAASREIADKLAIDDAWYVDIVKPLKALQSLCARRLAAGELRRFERLDFLFNTLANAATPQARLRLLRVLRSHWVPLVNAVRLSDAIDRLHAPAAGEPPANVVVLNTESARGGLVAELHGERRFLPYGLNGRWISLPPGAETEDAARDFLLGALRELYDDPEFPVDELVPFIDEQRRQADAPIHVFVHVGGAATAAYLLPVLRQFWSCLFVLTADDRVCDALAAELGTTAVRPVDPAQEKTQVRALGFARTAALGA